MSTAPTCTVKQFGGWVQIRGPDLTLSDEAIIALIAESVGLPPERIKLDTSGLQRPDIRAEGDDLWGEVEFIVEPLPPHI